MSEDSVGQPTGIDTLLRSKLRVINIGLASFGTELRRANVDVIQMSWAPPTVTNLRLLELLSKLS